MRLSAAKTSRKSISIRQKEILAGYCFIAPSVIGYLIFVLIPTISIFFLATVDWNLINDMKFVGLSNFRDIFSDYHFLNSLKVSALYVLVNIPFQYTFAIILALLLRNITKGLNFYRTIVLLPWITTPLTMSIVWRWILNPQAGIINFYLEKIGLSSPNWFGQGMALITVSGVNIWLSVGFSTILLFVGMQSIPKDYYEAANVDGVSGLKVFLHITLPLLKPTILYMTVTGLINSFQVFDAVYSMTQGGPGESTNVIYYSIYKEAFQFLKMGRAAAMCVVLFLILLSITIIQLLLFREKEE